MSRLSNSRATGSPLLCYVTDRRGLEEGVGGGGLAGLLEKIAKAAVAGLDMVQIREKDLSGRDLAVLTREALRVASHALESGKQATCIVVNERLNVALAEGAGGVHLGEKSMPVQEARRVIQAARNARRITDFLAGVSCHSLDGAQEAEENGADYIFFGPVFATPSKSVYGAPQGLDRLRAVCDSVKIPALAIGGITIENAACCAAAGAAGIAAIRMFQDAPDLGAVVRALRKSLR